MNVQRKVTNLYLCAKVCYIIFIISMILFYLLYLINKINKTKSEISELELLDIIMLIILICIVIFFTLYIIFKMMATKHNIQLINKLIIDYGYDFNKIPFVDKNKTQVLYKESDVLTNLYFRKYIIGKISEVPFSWHFLKVSKGYWLLFLSFGYFLLKVIDIGVLFLLMTITYFLFRYFKGDYMILNFNKPFSFNLYSKNIKFIKKEILNLPFKEKVNSNVFYFDNVSMFETYITEDFLRIIEKLSVIGKVEFAFYQNQFHLALKNNQSIYNNAVWIKHVQQIKYFYFLNDILKQLVQYINDKNMIGDQNEK